MKYCKSNLFSIFLILVAIVIVISTIGLIFRAVKQSNVYEGFSSSSSSQYYDPTIPQPSINSNVTPNGFAPLGTYSSDWSGNANSTCTSNQLDFAVVFQNSTTGYYSQTPAVLGTAYNSAYCNPNIYVALNASPPANTQLVLLNSITGANNWYIVDIPVSPANGGGGSIQGAFMFSGNTALIGNTPFAPVPIPTPPKPPPAPAPKPPPAPAPKPPPAPAPKPTPPPAPNKKSDINTNQVCIPTNSDGSFTYKDPNSKYPNKPDPNYIYSNSNPPASGIFDQWTANYNQYLNSNYYWYGGSINKYSTYAPMANSRVPNGTDCSSAYSCSHNTTNPNCLPSPGPTPPSCPSNCKKVTGKDLLMANNTYGVCSFDKKSETYTCAPCPTYGSDGMDCNQFQECSGCPASMTVPGLKPIYPRRKHHKWGGGGSGGQCGGINGICYKGNDGWSDGSDNDDGSSDGGGNGGGGSGGDKYRRRDNRHHHHHDERER